MRTLCLFLLCYMFGIDASEPLIRKKLITKNSVCFYVATELSNTYVRHPLRIAYPHDIDLTALPPSIVDIPLITNVIAVVWLSGQEYIIEEMDEDLYYSLITIKEFFKRFFYNTAWDGELKPKRLVKNSLLTPHGQSAAALFTGGLDSTTTVFRHFDEELTLISFNDVHQNAVDFAKAHHFNHSTIYMNYYDFLTLTYLDKASIDISKWFWDTSMGLSWVGAAAPFLYAKGIPLLYIPSGFTWQSFMFPDGQTLQQPACPLIDENLSPAGLSVKHDVFTMTRTDKIQFVSTFCAERSIPKPKLVVCNRHKRSNTSYSHCNRCTKCYLTMLDIVAIGEKLQEYGFTLSEEEFITQCKSYISTLRMRRGGTYAALHDTQNYLRRNIENLPQAYRTFYDWFIAVDLWSLVNESPNRPPRTIPFNWHDYQDLYRRDVFN